MAENVKSYRSFVKEIHIDKGVFPLKSKITGKFSASDSYKENLAAGNLPSSALTEFKEATVYLFYATENRELISYNLLHKKIADEKAKMINDSASLTVEEQKRIQIESSKKILKEYGINDRTLLIYSPVLTKTFQEEEPDSNVSVTFDPNEKILFVKTEWLPKEKAVTISEDIIENAPVVREFHETPLQEISGEPPLPNTEDSALPETNEHLITEEELQMITESTKKETNIPEKATEKVAQKPDIDELKKKYNFQRPKGESISDYLKRTKSGAKSGNLPAEEIPQVKDPEQEIRDIISDALHSLPGKWENDVYTVNFKEAGYLVPVEKVELDKNNIIIKSSVITNTEWWTKFTPIYKCPRFEGALEIPDEHAPFCRASKCNEACGAEDGFVELSAARFRLAEEKEIIKNEFKRLQQFLDRAEGLIEEFKSTFEVEIHLYTGTNSPYLYAHLKRPVDESVIRNYMEAFITIYTEITDIRGSVDIEEFSLADDFDPVSEDGLVLESKNYGLQEMVRIGAKDLLEDIIKQKGGKIEGRFYLIENGKMRYVLRPTRIEAIRDELYMGNITFKKGLNEVKKYLVTTLGGGRW